MTYSAAKKFREWSKMWKHDNWNSRQTSHIEPSAGASLNFAFCSQVGEALVQNSSTWPICRSTLTSHRGLCTFNWKRWDVELGRKRCVTLILVTCRKSHMTNLISVKPNDCKVGNAIPTFVSKVRRPFSSISSSTFHKVCDANCENHIAWSQFWMPVQSLSGSPTLFWIVLVLVQSPPVLWQELRHPFCSIGISTRTIREVARHHPAQIVTMIMIPSI